MALLVAVRECLGEAAIYLEYRTSRNAVSRQIDGESCRKQLRKLPCEPSESSSEFVIYRVSCLLVNYSRTARQGRASLGISSHQVSCGTECQVRRWPRGIPDRAHVAGTSLASLVRLEAVYCCHNSGLSFRMVYSDRWLETK